MRVAERSSRPGWDVSFVRVGGRLRRLDPLGVLDEVSRWERFLSTSAVFGPSVDRVVPEGVRLLRSVGLDVLGRGSRPTVPGWFEDALLERAAVVGVSSHPDAVMAAVVGPPGPLPDLDRSVELHGTFEVPLWRRVVADPLVGRFVVPQVSLEALAGVEASSSRWVDFVVAAPWMPSCVVEVDGSQHATQVGVDRERDGLLRATGLRVARAGGGETLAGSGAVADVLAEVEASAPGGVFDPVLAELVHAPSFPGRLGVLLLEALAKGALRPGGAWALTVTSDVGGGALVLALRSALDVLGAVDDVWGLSVVPDRVEVNGEVLVRSVSGRYVVSGEVAPGGATDATFRLECAVPVWGPVTGEGMVFTSRLCPLPVDVDFLSSVSPTLPGVGPLAERGLDVLVEDVHHHGGFREGQREAVLAGLEGRDACVLLPTGSGKSLVYQLVGLLRPGLVVVVDPIVSLVDDQVRSLRSRGVDRAFGLTSASGLSRSEGEALVASPKTNVLLVTPERFQVRSFREMLRARARRSGVAVLVVDEAHCVSEWGHDFRPSYLRLGVVGREVCAAPVLALTGTASPAVLEDLVVALELHDPLMVRPRDVDRPNLEYQAVQDTAGRGRTVWRSRLGEVLVRDVPALTGCDPALMAVPGDGAVSGIVFVPHTSGSYGVESVREVVRSHLMSVNASPRSRVGVYSGGAPRSYTGRDWSSVRAQTAAGFMSGELPLLVSTKAFGMGVDKPDVRFTIHVGFPGSLESFAQESGRAGRDGLPSLCAVVASLPEREWAEMVFSLRDDWDALLAEVGRRRGDDDLSRQLYFLTGSFPGLGVELRTATGVLRELGSSLGEVVSIPRGGMDAAARERALHRLILLGFVEDYVVDYGGDRFEVTVSGAHVSLDDALLGWVGRTSPVRVPWVGDALVVAPQDRVLRGVHHLGVLLAVVYRVVAPARLSALEEMYRLCATPRSGASIRVLLGAYLSTGPLAGVLAEVVTRPTLDVRSVLGSLRGIGVVSASEWTGAAARALESDPEHPVLHAARLVGEVAGGSVDGVRGVVAMLVAGMGVHGLSGRDRSLLVGWVISEAARLGAGGAALAAVWVGLPDEPWVGALEDERLSVALPEEALELLTRRLERSRLLLDTM